MQGLVTWTLNQYVLLAFVLAIFALSGFRRGINRELLLAIGIVLGIAISETIAPRLVPQANRFHRLLSFALRGGITSDDPAAAWQALGNLPPLISTAEDQTLLGVAVFASMVMLFFLIGQLQRAPGSLAMKVLGAVGGGINGFIVSYHLFPVLFPRPTAVVVPSGQLATVLTSAQTIASVALLFIVLLIALGLYNASRSRR
jgi:hypothetical protein